MNIATPITKKSSLAVLIGLALGVPSVTHASLDDIVLIKGTNTDTESMAFNVGGQQAKGGMRTACQNLQDYLVANGLMQVDGQYSGVGAELYNSVLPSELGMGSASSAEDALRDCTIAPTSYNSYSMLFTSCSMHMLDSDTLVSWTVPPGASEANMVVVDARSKQLITGGLLGAQVAGMSVQANSSSSGGSNVMGPTGDKDHVLLVSDGKPSSSPGGVRTFNAEVFHFSYEGDISIGASQGTGMSLGTMKTDGEAHIVSGFPGQDVIDTFYENFRAEILPIMQSGSLVTQMFEQMADLAARGVPIHTSQTVSMVGGLSSMVGGASARNGTTTTNTFEHVAVWNDGAARERLCSKPVTPATWTTTSMAEMMSGAGAGGNLTADQQQQMNEGMAELSKAMEGMTDEQKEALSGLGLGGLIPGTSQNQPAAAPAGSSAPSSNRSATSSASLMTDDLLQSIQLHLQALNIEPGNTSGEMDLNTQIAISQFQASKGMEPTGEASPQLLGVLAAEVDK